MNIELENLKDQITNLMRIYSKESGRIHELHYRELVFQNPELGNRLMCQISVIDIGERPDKLFNDLQNA